LLPKDLNFQIAKHEFLVSIGQQLSYKTMSNF